MPQIINTNISSINAQRNLNKSQGSLQTSLQRLSSGLRINSAKDDAAGLAISNRFITQVRGLNVAVRNANDGISLAQTTESALDEITTALQRIRDLAVQSANDTNSQADRISLQAEVDQLIDEVDRIATTTTFNGRNVLDGSLSSYYFQIGANSGEGVEVSGVDARINSLGSQPGAVQSTASSLATAAASTLSSFEITVGTNGTTVDVLSADSGGAITGSSVGALTDPSGIGYGAGAAKSLAERINELRQDSVDGLEGVYATAESSYDYSDITTTVAASDAYVGDGELAHGDLSINGVAIGPVTIQERDADGALRDAINAKTPQTGVSAGIDINGRLVLTAEDGRDLVISTQNGAAGILFNGGDNVTVAEETNDFKAGTLTVSAQDTIALGAGQSATDDNNVQAVGTIANADITTIEGSNITMEAIDSALAQIDGFRGELGAVQNRFESTIRNLSAVSESLSAANSRIRDADFAAETANLSKNQVLQQAGISVLAQANALPQQVLSLLQG
ncbi:MAG: flagellin [Pseudomonadales bacterium]|nr:flagellin [Pseudomonadales bacterium]